MTAQDIEGLSALLALLKREGVVEFSGHGLVVKLAPAPRAPAPPPQPSAPERKHVGSPSEQLSDMVARLEAAVGLSQ